MSGGETAAKQQPRTTGLCDSDAVLDSTVFALEAVLLNCGVLKKPFQLTPLVATDSEGESSSNSDTRRLYPMRSRRHTSDAAKVCSDLSL